jgi:membrane-bound serine protease (ClpP class)
MEIEIILALSVIGALLIAVDFYLPGFILASVGGCLMLVATWLCWQHHSLVATALLFCAEVLFGVGAAWLSIKYYPQTKFGKRMMLDATLKEAQSSTNASADLVGRQGIAQTVLRPAGKALVDGKRLDVVAESGMIAAGAAVKVTAVEGPKVVVRQIT